MAMSDTEMALMMGANQLSAMRPVNPGAFSGIEAGMAPPLMGAMSDQEAAMMRSSMPASPMPNPMASRPPMSDQEAAMMRSQMPSGNMPTPDFQNEESMMRYIQEKARQIRERMGGAVSDADMGALDAVMKSMPPQSPPPTGAMSDRERMMMGAK
mgnify:FL=1|tara:strand:- start:2769 stop:3233 length:465 start_codon:yes stop_codon:yes gene_type:complete